MVPLKTGSKGSPAEGSSRLCCPLESGRHKQTWGCRTPRRSPQWPLGIGEAVQRTLERAWL